jgi:hypothetical protein
VAGAVVRGAMGNEDEGGVGAIEGAVMGKEVGEEVD